MILATIVACVGLLTMTGCEETTPNDPNGNEQTDGSDEEGTGNEDGTGEEELFALADRILRAFHGRVILNVGDILPANGDIRKVIALGEYVKRHPLNGRTAGR